MFFLGGKLEILCPGLFGHLNLKKPEKPLKTLKT